MHGVQPIYAYEKLRCRFLFIRFQCCLVISLLFFNVVLFVNPLSIFPEMEQDQEQSLASSSKTQAQLRIEKSQVVY